METTTTKRQNDTKKHLVALYGGSFNPPTDSHIQIGKCIRDRVGVDEVWYLVSPQNPAKTTDTMADFQHRLAMTAMAVKDEPKLIVKDIEGSYGTTRTADTLRHLIRNYHDTRFIWVMGADNLADFHLWHDHEWILDHFPLIVVPRRGYVEKALASPTANSPHSYRLHNASALRRQNGWHLLPKADSGLSATQARASIQNKVTPIGLRPSVMAYIQTNNLYAPQC